MAKRPDRALLGGLGCVGLVGTMAGDVESRALQGEGQSVARGFDFGGRQVARLVGGDNLASERMETPERPGGVKVNEERFVDGTEGTEILFPLPPAAGNRVRLRGGAASRRAGRGLFVRLRGS